IVAAAETDRTQAGVARVAGKYSAWILERRDIRSVMPICDIEGDNAGGNAGGDIGAKAEPLVRKGFRVAGIFIEGIHILVIKSPNPEFSAELHIGRIQGGDQCER